MIKSQRWLLENADYIGLKRRLIKGSVATLTLAQPKMSRAIMSGEYICLPPGMMHELVTNEFIAVPKNTVMVASITRNLSKAGLLMNTQYIQSADSVIHAPTFAGSSVEIKVNTPFLDVMFYEIES